MALQGRRLYANLSFVKWVGHYDSAYRIEQGVLPEAGMVEQSFARSLSLAKSDLEPQIKEPSMSQKAPPAANVFLVSFQSPEKLDEAVVDEKIRQMASIHGVLSIEALRIRRL